MSRLSAHVFQREAESPGEAPDHSSLATSPGFPFWIVRLNHDDDRTTFAHNAGGVDHINDARLAHRFATRKAAQQCADLRWGYFSSVSPVVLGPMFPA